MRCGACGRELDWGEGRRAALTSGRPRHVRRRTADEAFRRRVEPWQVISFLAVGVLVVFLVWTEVARDRAMPAATTVQPSQPLESPLRTAQIDIGPLESAVAANPKDADAVLRLANALHDNRMLPRAIEQYKNYLTMRPENPDARVDLGACYDQMGLADSLHADEYYALAMSEMETALKGSPSHQPAAFNLGIVSLHRGDLEASNSWLKRAVAMNRESDLGKRATEILRQHSFTP
jgi:tetratricopeptide (TPR) repeat protein